MLVWRLDLAWKSGHPNQCLRLGYDTKTDRTLGARFRESASYGSALSVIASSVRIRHRADPPRRAVSSFWICTACPLSSADVCLRDGRCAMHRTRGHCAFSAMLTVFQLSKSFDGRSSTTYRSKSIGAIGSDWSENARVNSAGVHLQSAACGQNQL